MNTPILARCLRASHPPRLIQSHAFSTTRAAQYIKVEKWFDDTPYTDVPPHPYPRERHYNRANVGLCGGVRTRFGDNVAGEWLKKTRRRWKPNVQSKRLWSVSLQRFVRIKLVTRVLRSIDRCGGIDEYLLGEKATRLRHIGPLGWMLRWRIMQTDSVRERMRCQREAMGLDGTPPWQERSMDASLRQLLEERGLTLVSVPGDPDPSSDEKLAADADQVDRFLDEQDRLDQAEGKEAGASEAEDSGFVVEEDRGRR